MTTDTISLLSSTLRSIVAPFEPYDDDDGSGAKSRDDFEMMLSALHIACPDLRELMLLEEHESAFSLDARHLKSLADLSHLQRFTSRISLDIAA